MWGDEDVGVETRKAKAATPSIARTQSAPSGISPFAAAAPGAKTVVGGRAHWGSDSSDEEAGGAAPQEQQQDATSLLDESTGCTTDFAAGMAMFSKARQASETTSAAAVPTPSDSFDPFSGATEEPAAAAPASAAPTAAVPAAPTLTKEQLSAAPAEEHVQMLGNALYPRVQALAPDLAGKVTGMLLEMGADALLPLLVDSAALAAQVAKAVEVFTAYEAEQHQQGTAAPATASATPTDTPAAMSKCVKDLGKALKENNSDKLERVVASFGVAECRAVLDATQQCESDGGMLTDAGDRRRSPGGVFFKLLQDAHPDEMKVIITANNKARKAAAKAKAKAKGAAKGKSAKEAVADAKGTKHPLGSLGSPEMSTAKRARVAGPAVKPEFPSLFAAVKAGAGQ